MSLLAGIVRVLVRRLPEDEREAIGRELRERANNPNAETATPPEHTGPNGIAPDWRYVWNALVDASAHAGRIEDLLSDRDDAPFDIVEGLLTSDLDAFTYELFPDRISLMRAPSWAGPLYRIGGNGNHRIHTARVLNLPWLAAAVEVESIATSWGMLGLIADDPDRDEDKRQPLEKRLHERAVLVAGLIRRGIIDGELTDDRSQPTLHCRRLPAAWLLRAPAYATKVNAVYESRYPGAAGHPCVDWHRPRRAWTRCLTAQ